MVLRDARSQVDVWVQDLQGRWQNICTQTSDFGHKLITLVSGSIVIQGETEKHPPNAPARPEASTPPKASPASAETD